MKLSEAIREGAKLRPQASGLFFQLRDGIMCSCALGAAYDALESLESLEMHDGGDNIYEELERTYPFLESPVVCPICSPKNAVRQIYGSAIVHLNDAHKWSREQIADWLEREGL